jgi:hypothetical protein
MLRVLDFDIAARLTKRARGGEVVVVVDGRRDATSRVRGEWRAALKRVSLLPLTPVSPVATLAADPYRKQLILQVYTLLRVKILRLTFKSRFLSSRDAAEHVDILG